MQHIGRDDDERSWPDALPIQVIVTECNAADRGYRRVETDRFFDDGTRFSQTIGDAGDRSGKLTVRFGLHPLAPFP